MIANQTKITTDGHRLRAELNNAGGINLFVYAEVIILQAGNLEKQEWFCGSMYVPAAMTKHHAVKMAENWATFFADAELVIDAAKVVRELWDGVRKAAPAAEQKPEPGSN